MNDYSPGSLGAAGAVHRPLREVYVDLMPDELARPELLARALREGEALDG